MIALAIKINNHYCSVNVFGEEPHLRTVESGHVSETTLVLLSTFMIDL